MFFSYVFQLTYHLDLRKSSKGGCGEEVKLVIKPGTRKHAGNLTLT